MKVAGRFGLAQLLAWQLKEKIKLSSVPNFVEMLVGRLASGHFLCNYVDEVFRDAERGRVVMTNSEKSKVNGKDPAGSIQQEA